MVTKRWTFAVLLVGLLLGVVVGQNWDSFANAQAPAAAKSVLRYQISAYAGTTSGAVHHGCYIVDTTTGQVWHTRAGGTAEQVSGSLPQ